MLVAQRASVKVDVKNREIRRKRKQDGECSVCKYAESTQETNWPIAKSDDACTIGTFFQ